MPQLAHTAPPAPHFAAVGGDTHVDPEQQPEAQDETLQTHAPPEHTWPEPHGGFAPHLQTPPGQLSAVMPQLVHAAPFVPHADAVGGEVHVDPEQQPEAQVPEPHPLHTPPVHVSGLGQLEQAAPPVPQSIVELPGWHLPEESQHPVGHELALQTQVPPEQTWPVAHAAPPPHLHCPPTVQVSAVLPQLTHDAPATPQEATVGGLVQLDPVQQPSGHDVELQTHSPPEQT